MTEKEKKIYLEIEELENKLYLEFAKSIIDVNTKASYSINNPDGVTPEYQRRTDGARAACVDIRALYDKFEKYTMVSSLRDNVIHILLDITDDENEEETEENDDKDDLYI